MRLDRNGYSQTYIQCVFLVLAIIVVKDK